MEETDIKGKLAKSGWILVNERCNAPFDFRQECKYYLKRYVVDILAIMPLIAILLCLFIIGKFGGKSSTHGDKKKKIVLGTHPIITFNIARQILSDEYDCTLFAFKEWSNGSFHNGITAVDIMPRFIAGGDPYLFGSYWAFIWAIKNFDVFCLYFDGGFLERTLWWRIEPVIYQLFGKKVLLHPYGADVWDTLRNTNRPQKVGHMSFNPKYFDLDLKRIRRAYWWSKYVNFVFGPVGYIDFLPRIDVFTSTDMFFKRVPAMPRLSGNRRKSQDSPLCQ